MVYLIFAGLISNNALSVFATLVFCIQPYQVANIGLSFAVNSYISLAVGQKNLLRAQSFMKAAMVVTGYVTTVAFVFFLVFGVAWMRFFSQKEKLVE